MWVAEGTVLSLEYSEIYDESEGIGGCSSTGAAGRRPYQFIYTGYVAKYVAKP
jgi:hypothetical protein